MNLLHLPVADAIRQKHPVRMPGVADAAQSLNCLKGVHYHSRWLSIEMTVHALSLRDEPPHLLQAAFVARIAPALLLLELPA